MYATARYLPTIFSFSRIYINLRIIFTKKFEILAKAHAFYLQFLSIENDQEKNNQKLKIRNKKTDNFTFKPRLSTNFQNVYTIFN